MILLKMKVIYLKGLKFQNEHNNNPRITRNMQKNKPNEPYTSLNIGKETNPKQKAISNTIKNISNKTTKLSPERVIKKDNVIELNYLIKEPKIVLKRLPKEIIHNKLKSGFE